MCNDKRPIWSQNDPKPPCARAQSCKGTKPHLETLRRTAGIKSRAMLSHAPDDKASAFDLLGFPEIDRAHSLQSRIFSTSATPHFTSWVVANTSMLLFVVTVPPPWRAW